MVCATPQPVIHRIAQISRPRAPSAPTQPYRRAVQEIRIRRPKRLGILGHLGVMWIKNTAAAAGSSCGGGDRPNSPNHHPVRSPQHPNPPPPRVGFWRKLSSFEGLCCGLVPSSFKLQVSMEVFSPSHEGVKTEINGPGQSSLAIILAVYAAARGGTIFYRVSMERDPPLSKDCPVTVLSPLMFAWRARCSDVSRNIFSISETSEGGR